MRQFTQEQIDRARDMSHTPVTSFQAGGSDEWDTFVVCADGSVWWWDYDHWEEKAPIPGSAWDRVRQSQATEASD